MGRQRPEMSVRSDSIPQELEVEGRKGIDNLVDGVLLDAPDHRIPAEEPAQAKFFKAPGRILPGPSGDGFADFRPRHSRLPPTESLDDGQMAGRALEEGCEEPATISQICQATFGGIINWFMLITPLNLKK